MVQRKHNSRDSARCVNNGGDLSLAQPPFNVKPVMIGSIEQSPQRYARVAGVLYLAIIALGAFGELGVRGTLVVPGDAAATWARIGQSPWLWRCGIVGDLLMHVLDVPVLVILYVLLRPAVEAAVFPTVAYFGGPGELAYLERANLVRDAVGDRGIDGVFGDISFDSSVVIFKIIF